MLQRLRHRAQGQEGFTLIELLVVVLIIGILAAVAIPVFLNQTGKAQDANVKSDLNSAETAMETFYTDNQNYNASIASLESINPSLTTAVSKNSLAIVASPTTGLYGATDGTATIAYEFTETSTSKVLYGVTKWSDGTISTTCQVPANTSPGGCKSTTASSELSSSSSSTQNGVW